MTTEQANKSLATYTRFQVKPDSIWYSVTCDNHEMIGGFATVAEAYQWAIKEESALVYA